MERNLCDLEKTFDCINHQILLSKLKYCRITGKSHTWIRSYLGNTRSDSKVMRLVPKKSFILFINQLKYGNLQSTSLVPAHTFSSGTTTVCSIPGTQLEDCRLRPALQTSGCLLSIQNGVLSLPILLFEIRRSRRARDQVSKEAAASP